MNALQALILGIVEGITEYLPVSSTGHLLVAQRLLGIGEGATANAFAIAIQAGAILAVLGTYRQRVLQILAGFLGRDRAGLNLGLCLLAAFLPSAVLGVLFDKRIEAALFGVKPVIYAWIAGGFVIILLNRWVEKHRTGKDLSELTWQAALLIGFIQCISMWPGTSRSLVVILGGLAVGLSLSAAVEFAFLLGVITLTAATGYKAVTSGGEMLTDYGWLPLATGFIAAWVSAALAVKWMVAWLNKHGLGLFAWWRFIAAGLAALLLL